ncbi:heterogeneous nuclear ribonucleoprotein 1-like [Capsicum annuum]|uniref:heterogeneous nuclear ribonucleoprotein 1-like n=1 Tax=Capsicum annuum TaxID=4072 RepID=UPI001FB1935B|nr:heterogeneous nuclear ribonucleoprotein 1-like [Capsicum annuum]
MDSDETKRPRTETNKGKEKVGDSSLRKLLVEDIAVETTEESLREHFNQFGKVIDSVIITNENSGRPWRYGVVTYADSKGLCLKCIFCFVYKVHVKKEAPKEDMHVKGAPKTEKKFIGGLPPFDDDSKKDFSSLGFVISDDEEAVEKVSADGCMHELHGKQVEIKRAEPKSAGAELASENQLHHGGSISKSHRGDSGSVEGFGGAYGGNMGAGHGGYGGYEGYGNYGGYRKVAGSYGDITLYMVDTVMEAAAMVHLMPAVTDMGAPLGSTVGNPAGYDNANRYGNRGSSDGNSAGYDNANRYGNRGSSDGNSAGYVNANRYGNRGGNPASYDNANRYGNRGRRGGANANWNNDGSFHPY